VSYIENETHGAAFGDRTNEPLITGSIELTMERRTYLGSLGTVGITSVAGCLGDLLGGDSNPDTILEPRKKGPVR